MNLSITRILSSDIFNLIPLKFSRNSLQLLTNLVATDCNVDKINRNFTATFAKIGRNFTATFCLLRSCGTATFSKNYCNYIVPLITAHMKSCPKRPPKSIKLFLCICRNYINPLIERKKRDVYCIA